MSDDIITKGRGGFLAPFLSRVRGKAAHHVIAADDAPVRRDPAPTETSDVRHETNPDIEAGPTPTWNEDESMADMDDMTTDLDTSDTVTNAPESEDDPNLIRKKALIDQVVAETGIKKKDAKPVIEATLAAIGAHLSDGKTLQMQPLGKLKVTRSRALDNGEVLVCKLRRTTPKPSEPTGETFE